MMDRSGIYGENGRFVAELTETVVLEFERTVEQVADFEAEDTEASGQPVAQGNIGDEEVIAAIDEAGTCRPHDSLSHVADIDAREQAIGIGNT